MRCEAVLRELGNKLAEGLVRRGVAGGYAEYFCQEWSREVDRMVSGESTTVEGYAFVLSRLTLARDLVEDAWVVGSSDG